MIERPKILKVKSKFIKKPLQLKNTISQTLQCNIKKQKIKKIQQLIKPIKNIKLRPTIQQKQMKMIQLYQKVQKQNNDDCLSSDFDELLMNELQKKEQIVSSTYLKRQQIDQKKLLFSHFMKDSLKIERKMSDLESNINQKIRKDSIEYKIRRVNSLKQSKCSHLYHNQNNNNNNSNNKLLNLLDKKSSFKKQQLMCRSEINLSNMKLSYLPILQLKQKLNRIQKLKILDLSYNNLTNKSIPIIIQILSQNLIQQFSLKWNQITYQGGALLIDGIVDNNNLLSLNIGYNNLNSKQQNLILSLLKLFQSNKYLIHLNLQMCQINQQQCKIISQYYNIHNLSIISCHFKGNSHYYTNKLGYIVSNNIQSSHNIIIPSSKIYTQDQNQIKSQTTSKIISQFNILSDCCWLCEHWIKQQFIFLNPKLPSYINNTQQNNLFIHLSCYDYQPIKMLQTACIKSNLRVRKQFKKLQWSDYLLYKIQIAIPSNKDITYFFTNNNNIILNKYDPIIQYNKIIQFQLFDLFHKQQLKYKIYLNNINIKQYNNFIYNKYKKLSYNQQQYQLKSNIQYQNKNALISILNLNNINDKLSLQTQSIKSTIFPRHLSSTHSKSTNLIKINSNHNITLNIRKYKQKIYTHNKSQKYIYLSIIPRNKQYLYNYISQNQNYYHNISYNKLLKQKYFSSFQNNFYTSFLIKRHMYSKYESFTDRFKIITRKCYYKKQVLLKNIYNLIYQNYLQLDHNHNQYSKSNSTFKQYKIQKVSKNKSVKFATNKDKNNISITTNSQKQDNNIKTCFTLDNNNNVSGKQKKILRRALSQKYNNNKFELSKAKFILANSDKIIQFEQTSKTIKTNRHIKDIQSDTLHKLYFPQQIIPNLQLKQLILNNYKKLISRYNNQKIIIQLLNQFDKQKIKDMNDIIQTFNYYKLCQYYDQIIQSKINQQFKLLSSCQQLIKYISKDNNIDQNIQNHQQSNKSSSLDENNQLQFQDTDMSINQLQTKDISHHFISFITFLFKDTHFIKTINKTQNHIMKSSKKRAGKYGKSLKNIKQQLMHQQTKIIIPSNSSKFLLEIQKQQANMNYNHMIKQLTIISNIFIKILQKLIHKYFQQYYCNQKQSSLIKSWIMNTLINKISHFIHSLLDSYKINNKIQYAYNNKKQIYQSYILNTIIQLIKLNLLLNSNIKQDIKQYNHKFIYSYDYTLNIQINKITSIISSIHQNQNFIKQNIASIITLLAIIWKQYQIETLKRQKLRKQTEISRRKRFKNKNIIENNNHLKL